VSEPLLRVRGLGKTWPNGVRALEGVDLDVAEGEFVVVIGLSGSGKSTLLRCLNRLVEPTEGSVRFLGREVTGASGRDLRRARREMAMIFQAFHLVRRHAVLTNVLLGSLERAPLLRSLSGWWGREARAEALDHLEAVGLRAEARRRADALSGGQQQRVAIARALMQGPRLLLADEPVASLDPALSRSVMNHIARLRTERGITVVASLHLLALAREYGTRVVALRAGRKVFDGAPKELTAERYREIYGEDAPPGEAG
jgi:phosphonate transport system ATP-binding protein